ncbi:MAG: hypothetical protein ACTSV7_06725 [Candidatus Baldrarchaeia archaeon]
MKRYMVIREFLKCLNDNDIALFSGSETCKEAFQYDRKGNFYIIEPPEIVPSIALGTAMNTDKRVFVFIDDEHFLKDMGVSAQIAVSNCVNIFYIILRSGCYQSSGFQPTIFGGISGAKSFLFGLGFVVHEFSKYFEDRNFSAMKGFVENIKGPMAILINIDKGLKKGLKDIKKNIDLKSEIKNFIVDEDLGTSLFVPPTVVIDRDST